MSYIKRETLLQTAKQLLRDDAFGGVRIVREIENAPAEDVVEVRHGCWKICGVFDDFLKCSFCHSDYPWMTASYYKYCPTCGAKMDGERRTNNE